MLYPVVESCLPVDVLKAWDKYRRNREVNFEGKWWDGPSRLKTPESLWLHTNIICPEEALIERRKVVIRATNIQANEVFSRRFLYFSKYPILRLTAWILRFCENSKTKKKIITKALNSKEIENSEFATIKIKKEP